MWNIYGLFIVKSKFQVTSKKPYVISKIKAEKKATQSELNLKS